MSRIPRLLEDVVILVRKALKRQVKRTTAFVTRRSSLLALLISLPLNNFCSPSPSDNPDHPPVLPLGGMPWQSDPTLTPAQITQLQALQSQSSSGITAYTWQNAGTVRYLAMDVPSGATGTPDQQALAFVRANGILWNLTSNTHFTVVSVTGSGPCTIVLLQRSELVAGIYLPVFNASLAVTIDPNARIIRQIIGNMTGDTLSIASATISGAIATATVANAFSNDGTPGNPPSPSTIVFDGFFVADKPHAPVVSYQFLDTVSNTTLIVSGANARDQNNTLQFSANQIILNTYVTHFQNDLTCQWSLKCVGADPILQLPEVIPDPIAKTPAAIGFAHICNASGLGGMYDATTDQIQRALAIITAVSPAYGLTWSPPNVPNNLASTLRNGAVKLLNGGAMGTIVKFDEYFAGYRVEGANLAVTFASDPHYATSITGRFAYFPDIGSGQIASGHDRATAVTNARAQYVTDECGLNPSQACKTARNADTEYGALSPVLLSDAILGSHVPAGNHLAWKIIFPLHIYYWGTEAGTGFVNGFHLPRGVVDATPEQDFPYEVLDSSSGQNNEVEYTTNSTTVDENTSVESDPRASLTSVNNWLSVSAAVNGRPTNIEDYLAQPPLNWHGVDNSSTVNMNGSPNGYQLAVFVDDPSAGGTTLVPAGSTVGAVQSLPSYIIDLDPNYLAADIFMHEFAHQMFTPLNQNPTTDPAIIGFNNSYYPGFENLLIGESGALEESFADLMAELIFPDQSPRTTWKIGETLAGGAIRDMANPHNSNPPQPANEQDIINCAAGNQPPCQYPCAQNLNNQHLDDSQCIHAWSGVPNAIAVGINSNLANLSFMNSNGVHPTAADVDRWQAFWYMEWARTASRADQFYNLCTTLSQAAHFAPVTNAAGSTTQAALNEAAVSKACGAVGTSWTSTFGVTNFVSNGYSGILSYTRYEPPLNNGCTVTKQCITLHDGSGLQDTESDQTCCSDNLSAPACVAGFGRPAVSMRGGDILASFEGWIAPNSNLANIEIDPNSGLDWAFPLKFLFPTPNSNPQTFPFASDNSYGTLFWSNWIVGLGGFQVTPSTADMDNPLTLGPLTDFIGNIPAGGVGLCFNPHNFVTETLFSGSEFECHPSFIFPGSCTNVKHNVGVKLPNGCTRVPGNIVSISLLNDDVSPNVWPTTNLPTCSCVSDSCPSCWKSGGVVCAQAIQGAMNVQNDPTDMGIVVSEWYCPGADIEAKIGVQVERDTTVTSSCLVGDLQLSP
jgi:hypothetical protein